MTLNPRAEAKMSKEVASFINAIKRISKDKGKEMEELWVHYKPEVLKSQTRQEMARILLSFFERGLRYTKDKADAKDFHRLKYDAVGNLQNCLFSLGVNKNVMRDYTKHLHSIQGKELERGIRMKEEKPWETPEEVEGKKQIKYDELRKAISTDELRKKLKWKSRQYKKQDGWGVDLESLVAVGFAIGALIWFLLKLF